MISVILYGKNDSYGYNLHKRAAISLNTLAEVLTAPTDEILFVDYNTVDDLPTFPEAIRDTLTAKARKLLRIIRVRGPVHARKRLDSRLAVSEPLARNIGVRRMRPGNRWALSTNTDMVFLPRNGQSLSEIAANLPDGYYGLPRFEIPETLWETSDRMDPRAIMADFKKWGERYCLNETAYSVPFILYDAPGDFQLFPASAFDQIHGYNERMVHGWHVDSNLCKRMQLHFGTLHSLAEVLLGYHCDHTRVTTPAHASNKSENSWATYCDGVDTPYVPEQAQTWGLAGEPLEELALTAARSTYEDALDALYAGVNHSPAPVLNAWEAKNSHPFYDTLHAFPYLADNLVALPRDSTVAYMGRNETLKAMLGDFLKRMGFTRGLLAHNPLEEDAPEPPDRVGTAQSTLALAEADLFLCDFHFPAERGVRNRHGHTVLRFCAANLRDSLTLLTAFVRLARLDQHLQALGRPPRKFLVLGLDNTHMQDLVGQAVGLVVAPHSCHIRHGFVRPGVDLQMPEQALAALCGLAPSAFEDIAGGLLARTARQECLHEFLHVFAEAQDAMHRVAEDPAALRGAERDEAVRSVRLFFTLAVMMGRFGAAAVAHATLLRLAAGQAEAPAARPGGPVGEPEGEPEDGASTWQQA